MLESLPPHGGRGAIGWSYLRKGERMAEVKEEGGDWTDPEIKRFLKREATFLQEGLEPHEAERLAQQMLYRDRPDSGDDRRVCFECKHLRENARCRPGYLPLRFVLQRCEGFDLKGAGSAGKTRTEESKG